jgi:hypothetical protein
MRASGHNQGGFTLIENDGCSDPGSARNDHSPGTRALPMAQKRPDIVMNPVKIAEAFYYLHTQDRSCWTHELQLTPFPTKPSF